MSVDDNGYRPPTTEAEARDILGLGATEPAIHREADGTLTVKWPNDMRQERTLISSELLEAIVADLDVLSRIKVMLRATLGGAP